MKIVLTGTLGAGKGMAAKYLFEQGLKVYSTGDVARQILGERRETIERANLQQVGYDSRRELIYGILEKLKEEGRSDDFVIDCARYPEQVEMVRWNFSPIFIIAVDASEDVRCERLINRERAGDPRNREEFDVQNEMDLCGYLQQRGQDVRGCLSIADKTFYNNGTREEFYSQLDEWLGSARCS